MARSLRIKPLLPSLIHAGRPRSFSEVASNFPFANAGEGFRTRYSAGINNYAISSSGRMFNKSHWGNVHPTMASSKQPLAFPTNKSGGVENLKHSPPASTGDYDEFEELGPSIQPSACSGSDLEKEKHKDSMRPGFPSENESHQAREIHMQQPPERKSHLRSPVQDNCHSDTNFNRLNQKYYASKTKSESEKQKHAVENHQVHRAISIDKVPPYISLLNLREAVSAYGEISSASLTTGPDRLTSCHVEFKCTESKERVLAAQRITVGNCQLPVRDLYIPEYITVRIGNISMDTAEPAVHSMCTSCGDVAGLARTKEGAIDVVFRVKGNLEAQSILRRLNDVYYDDCRWRAQLAPILGKNSRTEASGTQWSVGSQINNLMETFRKQFQMQRIYLEDLENLHYSILHLRDRPADLNTQLGWLVGQNIDRPST